jgi:YidC/Oxa1 family membrane protein insertase
MDKRFFLALVLTGAVVLLTPVLFPRPTLPTPVVPTDSMAAAASPTAGALSASAPSGAPSAAPMAGVPSSLAPAAPEAAAPAPTTVTLTNTLASYTYSSQGAAFVSATLPKYTRLGATTGTVALEAPAEPLLRYRLIAGGDTVRFDQLAFTPSSVAPAIAPAMTNAVTFTAPVGQGGEITVAYALADTNYLAEVRITARGIPSPAFLLTDLPTGFLSQERDSTDDHRHLAYASRAPIGGAERIDFRKPDPGERILRQGPLTWAVAKSKYFLVGMIAVDTTASPLAELQVTGAPRVNREATRAMATVVSPLGPDGVRFELYAGPQEWERLVAMGREFEHTNPYGGWISGLVQPFATIVMRVLLWMKRTLRIEYGWILVIFGVAIRLAMWPLNSKMMRSSIQMQRIAPLVQAAQEKHKGDPEKQRTAVMKVYQEAGISPFAPLAGCLPMLLPMPILFALFFVFQNTIEFRGVPFLWLPDISVKDPYYIVPLAMGLSMYALSWIGMRNTPPNPQTKMMSYVMPIMMTVFLFNFASGLNLYYAVQNLAALPQQWLIANERGKPPMASAPVQGGGAKRTS